MDINIILLHAAYIQETELHVTNQIWEMAAQISKC